jgi:hypothetical protein
VVALALALLAPIAFAQLQPSGAGSIPPEALGVPGPFAPDSAAAVSGGVSAMQRATRDVLQRITSMAGTASANDGTWSARASSATARFYHSAIYDPVRDRLIVFGGWNGDALSDAWALSLSGAPTWTPITTTGAPPPARYGHTAIYDPVRDRMVVFGGKGTAGLMNDVWSLSLAGTPAWTQASPSGAPPTARYGHAAIYDPIRDRMLIFGGYDGGVSAETWALSLASPAWSLVSTSGAPGPHMFHSAFYDPVRDRLMVFGGWNGGGYLNSTWALTLSGSPSWSAVAAGGPIPSARLGTVIAYDSARDQMLMFGGYGGTFLNDTWSLSLAGTPTWLPLTPAGPPAPRDLHAAILDPVRDRMLMYGGNQSGSPLSDTWSFSLASGTWSVLAGGGIPIARSLHSAIYDPVGQRMIVFGGYDGAGMNDSWVSSLGQNPSWSPLTTAGTSPSPRWGHSAIYDPVRNRMIVFGGRGADGFHDDVWALSLSGTPTWSALTPSGSTPSPRYLQSAIYDPVRDRLVVFAGSNGSSQLGDVWALTLSGTPTWSQIVASGTPPTARYLQSAIYDPVRDRMVVFGGLDASSYRSDTWALALAGSPTWNALTTTAGPPAPRLAHSAVYDPVRDRMVVFGGYGGDFFNDTWTLALAGNTWTQLLPDGNAPSVRELHTAIYDPQADAMWIFGGHYGSSPGLFFNDQFALTWGSVTPPGTGIAFDLSPNTINLQSHGLWVTGRLQPPSPFTADQIDVASIRLNGSVAVDPSAPISIGDHDGDGVSDLQVKFDRTDLEQTLAAGPDVPVTATGTVDGTPFTGTIHIRVLHAVVTAPRANAHLSGGAFTDVQWLTAGTDSMASMFGDSLAADSAHSVALLSSVDGGSTWDLTASGLPNTGNYHWLVPNVTSKQALLAVVLVQSADSTGDVVQGMVGVSEVFSIQGTVAVGDAAATRRLLLWASPNPSMNGRLTVQFTLRDGSPARIELLDLGGRVLAAEPVGRLGPGVHAIDMSKGTPLPSGVYFLRLVQGAEQVRARAILMQ